MLNQLLKIIVHQFCFILLELIEKPQLAVSYEPPLGLYEFERVVVRHVP